MGLFGDRGRGRFRKRVQQGLTTPSWQVVVGGKTWICPFCGAAALKRWPDDDEERVEAVLDHLDGDCHRFRGGEGEELPLNELRRAAARRELRRRIKRNLVSHHSWQLVDPKRNWLCPYCAEAAPVSIPTDRRMTEETLQGIVAHVESCYAWDHGRGQEKPHAQLKAIVKGQNALQKQVESVRRKLEGEPAWRRKDARQRWICPYCLAAQEHIDLSTNLLMFENAPRQIAQHLTACEAYRAGASPRPLDAAVGSQGGLSESGSTGLQSRPGSLRLEQGLLSGSETGTIRDDQLAPKTPLRTTESRRVEEPTRARAWGKEPGELRPSGPLPAISPPPAEPRPPARPQPSDRLPPLERPEKPEWNGPDRSGPDKNGPNPPGKPGKKGTTLGQLRASGEFTHIDEAEGRASPTAAPGDGAPAGSGKTKSGRQRALRDWRSMIEHELAQVRDLSPGLSGEIMPPQDGPAARLRELGQKLRLAERGYELRGVALHATPAPKGDFADAFDLGQDRLALVVGGVAGDEPETALVAAMARNLFRQHLAPDRCPSEVLERVNSELFGDLDGRVFFAAGVVLLDLPSRRLRLARAGLAAPLLVNATRDPVFAAIECEGLVMGIDKGEVFKSSLEVRALELFPGDMLVLHANGVLDARPAVNREEFGPERMRQLVRRYGTHEVDYLCEKFEEHMDVHHEGLAQRLSDACLVALKWNGPR